jgi:hypothetical protein
LGNKLQIWLPARETVPEINQKLSFEISQTNILIDPKALALFAWMAKRKLAHGWWKSRLH